MSDVKTATIKRILSAVIALPVYVYCFATDSFNSIPVLIVSIIVSITCLYEYYKIADKEEGVRPFIGVGVLFGIIVNVLMYIYAFGRVYGYNRYIAPFDVRGVFVITAVLIAIISILQIFKRPLRGGIYSLAVTVFGVVYIVFSFSHIILMKALKDGFYYILLLNLVIMLNDAGAYFGGVLYGKHKTKLAASPNKSWEGYFSGMLFSILAMIITSQVYAVFFGRNLFSIIEAAILGIILGILGDLGDLIESAIKRDGAIKDSGSIIPGHGGMWDVFDALIFVFPLFYYYLVLKGVQ
jgi:phosphatidate cytidylyltransferase